MKPCLHESSKYGEPEVALGLFNLALLRLAVSSSESLNLRHFLQS